MRQNYRVFGSTRHIRWIRITQPALFKCIVMSICLFSDVFRNLSAHSQDFSHIRFQIVFSVFCRLVRPIPSGDPLQALRSLLLYLRALWVLNFHCLVRRRLCPLSWTILLGRIQMVTSNYKYFYTRLENISP